MAYEKSRFGDGSAAGSGNVVKQVSNHFGQRDTGGTGGVSRTAGFEEELTIDLTAEMLNEGGFPVEPAYIKKGAKINKVFVETVKAFTVTGTSPVANIGTKDSEATNGVDVTEAQLETVGVYDITSTLSGTWAAAGGLTALTEVGVALGGTSPAVSGDGQVRVVIQYISTNSQAPLSNFG